MEKFYNVIKSDCQISEPHQEIYQCINILINHDVHFNELDCYLRLLLKVLIDNERSDEQKNKIIMSLTDKYFYLRSEIKNNAKLKPISDLFEKLCYEIKVLLLKMM